MFRSIAFSLFASRISVIGLNFLTFIVTARSIGPENLGIYGTGISAAIIISALARLGSGERMFELFHNYNISPRIVLGNVSLLSLLLVVIGTIVWIIIDPFNIDSSRTATLLFFLIGTESLLISSRVIAEFFFNLIKENKFLSWVGFTSVLPKCVCCLYLYGNSTLDTWLLGLIISNLIALTGFAAFLFKVKSIPAIQLSTFFSAFHFSLKAGIANFFNSLSFQIIRPILLQFVPAAQVGQLVFPQRVSQLGTLPISVFLQSKMSLTMANRSCGDLSQALQSFKKTIQYSVVCIISTCVLIYLAAPIFIQIFLGSKFIEAIPMMQFFAFVAASKSLVYLTSHINLTLKLESSQVWLSVLAFATTAIVFLSTVQLYEWKSAVYSVLAGDFLFVIVSVFTIYRAQKQQ